MRPPPWMPLVACLFALVAALTFATGGIDVIDLEKTKTDQSHGTIDQQEELELEDETAPGFTEYTQPTVDIGATLHILALIFAVLAVSGLVCATVYFVMRWLRGATRKRVIRTGESLSGNERALADETVKAGLTAIMEERDARTAIIACWQRVETQGVAVGVERLVSDTATDYGVRLLSRLNIADAHIQELKKLYLEARYSHHHIGEDQREQARALLESIRGSLAEKAGTQP